MISSDLANRLRLLMETAVQPLSAARELQSDLPQLSSGQRFTARIEAALPDGSYKAVVAGKSVTLSLPHAAKAGDALELVVIERTPRAVIAAQVAGQPQAPPAAPAATLSRAAQLIGAVLAEPGGAPAQPAALARGEPILQLPPASAGPLAQLLQTAVAESGVFYEAHQAQWIAGRTSLAALLREPQGRYSPQPQLPAAATPAPATLAQAASDAPGPKLSDVDVVPMMAEFSATRLHEAGSGRAAPAAGLPSDLAPVVRQQLDMLSTSHGLWQGQIWPGQTMQWEIEDPRREGSRATADDAETWTTTLRLALPRLGGVAATLRLEGAGVAVDLHATDQPAVDALRGGTEQLAHALEAAGLRLAALKVEHGEPA